VLGGVTLSLGLTERFLYELGHRCRQVGPALVDAQCDPFKTGKYKQKDGVVFVDMHERGGMNARLLLLVLLQCCRGWGEAHKTNTRSVVVVGGGAVWCFVVFVGPSVFV